MRYIKLYDHFGYRSGDLTKKAEDLLKMYSNRGTGHFGTGYYFFGNENSAINYDDRNITKVEFDDYNMFKVKSKDSGLDLHEALKKFNNGTFTYNIVHDTIKKLKLYDISQKIYTEHTNYSIFKIKDAVGDIISILKDIDVDKILDILNTSTIDEYSDEFEDKELLQICLNEIVSQYNISKELLTTELKNKMLNNLKKVFIENGYDINSSKFDELWSIYLAVDKEKISLSQSDLVNRDSASTRIMKYLGFDGIDVVGIDGLDNSMYGSVIFDIK